MSENIIESVMNNLGETGQTLGGLEGLGAMLALPDEDFEVMAPMILFELDKSLKNPNDRMVLAQMLNMNGVKQEDLGPMFINLDEQIDEQLTSISQAKRDFLKQMFSTIINAASEGETLASRCIKIPIELCHPDAKIPTYANATDAGMDVYALEDVTIHPGETKLIKTGLKVAIPVGYEIQVRPKSGRALKTKMRIANSPGTIDSGYRDEIGIIIDNIEPPIKDITYDFIEHPENSTLAPYIKITSILHGSDMHIGKGEKFAQLVLSEKPKALFFEVESVGDIINDGRAGGFGSTGLK